MFRNWFLFPPFLLVDGGNAISKILFLKARAMNKDAATLVASGPQGTVCKHKSSPFIHSFIEAICMDRVRHFNS